MRKAIRVVHGRQIMAGVGRPLLDLSRDEPHPESFRRCRAGPIRELPDELISQIAAGEVVERPGLGGAGTGGQRAGRGRHARSRCAWQAGGVRLISVVEDNGSGILRRRVAATPSNATPPARSPTCPIWSRSATMGFRGEALAAICVDCRGLASHAAWTRPTNPTAWLLDGRSGGELQAAARAPRAPRWRCANSFLQHARAAQIPEDRRHRARALRSKRCADTHSRGPRWALPIWHEGKPGGAVACRANAVAGRWTRCASGWPMCWVKTSWQPGGGAELAAARLRTTRGLSACACGASQA